ncbi:MAG: LysR family transcriptional regulator [Bacillota bacterium]|nr:LysR family transcriptional regulator [Bacillota bacterium]
MNNILHLKYAVEVEKTGSISKAADNLFIAQPHLSKTIKELEKSLGIVLFNRTPRGVIPTRKGEEFLKYARSIISQIEEMESLYKPSEKNKQQFDICVPRASYISFAFTEFIKELDLEKAIDINYRETNSMRAINQVAEGINNLGIIRYQTIYEKYFLNALEERELKYEPIWEFQYLALMSEKHPLATDDIIEFSKLQKYTEIIHGDLTVPALPVSEAKMIAQAEEKKKKIAVYERGSQFEILSRIPTTYMWVSPVPEDVLSCFFLVQKPCNMSKNKYKDILIYHKGYHLCEVDHMFIQKLNDTVQIVSNL